jgi:hypothetical protein
MKNGFGEQLVSRLQVLLAPSQFNEREKPRPSDHKTLEAGHTLEDC